MTFDDDFIELDFRYRKTRILCRANGIAWPPPPKLDIMGFVMVRDSFSQITDEQRKSMTHVMRGARYVLQEATS